MTVTLTPLELTILMCVGFLLAFELLGDFFRTLGNMAKSEHWIGVIFFAAWGMMLVTFDYWAMNLLLRISGTYTWMGF